MLVLKNCIEVTVRDKSRTHQDGQHNILEVVPQVGGVSAEEDKVALNQLQKSEIKHSDSQPCLVYSALSLGALLAALSAKPSDWRSC